MDITTEQREILAHRIDSEGMEYTFLDYSN